MSEIDDLRTKYTDSVAAEYEEKRSESEKWNREQELVTMLLGNLRSDDVKTVLDVPCGTGRFIPVYSSLGLTGTGVDASADMLQQARAKKKEKGLSQFQIQQGDVFDLSDINITPDVIVCVRFANWINKNDLDTVLEEFLSRKPRYIIIDVGLKGEYQSQTDRGSLFKKGIGILRDEGVVQFVRKTSRFIRNNVNSDSDSGPTLHAHKEKDLIEMFDDKGLRVVEDHLIADREQSVSKYSQRNLFLLGNDNY